jgi:hypothetical protein
MLHYAFIFLVVIGALPWVYLLSTLLEKSKATR